MVVLAVLIVLGFIVDVAFFILATGQFARVETRANLLKGEVKNLENSQQDMLKGFADLQKEFLNVRGLVGDIQDGFTELKSNLDIDAGNIETLFQDVQSLQLAAVNGKEPVTAVLETPRNRGGRPKKVTEVK